MKKLILILILAFYNNLYAQDHLEPNTGIFSELSIIREYHCKVIKILGEGLTHRSDAQLIIIPSFSKEVLWQIYHEEGSENYFAIFRTGTESIWYNQYEDKPKKIKTISKEIELNKETAGVILELLNTALDHVKYPESDRVGLDGENFYFSTFQYGRGTRSGTIWSPQSKTKMDELVKISRELINATEKGFQPTNGLLERMKQLTVKLKETTR